MKYRVIHDLSISGTKMKPGDVFQNPELDKKQIARLISEGVIEEVKPEPEAKDLKQKESEKPKGK